MHCILMRGLPGSGKSTRAKSQKGYKIFSRDTARSENLGMSEDQIRDLEKQFIMEGHEDIIIDNTHMNQSSIDSISLFCQGNGYLVTVKDMFEAASSGFGTNFYHSECSTRNNKREGKARVPQSVIDEMFLTNYTPDDYDRIGEYVIVDIDGTIADNSHRLQYIQETPKNRLAYESGIMHDKPIEEVISMIQSLEDTGYIIVLLTGRKSKECNATLSRMKVHNVPYDFILMRSDRDKDPDYIVKEKLYKKCLEGKKVLLTLEDRQRNMDMRKKNGLFVVNVNQGDPNF